MLKSKAKNTKKWNKKLHNKSYRDRKLFALFDRKPTPTSVTTSTGFFLSFFRLLLPAPSSHISCFVFFSKSLTLLAKEVEKSNRWLWAKSMKVKIMQISTLFFLLSLKAENKLRDLRTKPKAATGFEWIIKCQKQFSIAKNFLGADSRTSLDCAIETFQEIKSR